MIPSIHIEDYNYNLPDERIAKYPLAERDASKLLRYVDGNVDEYVFRNIPELLPAGALMVFNDTKVVPARLHFQRATGAHIEIFCGEHLDGFHNVAAVDDSHVAAPLNGVHGIKDFLPSHGDLHLHLFAQCRKAVPDLGGLGVRLAQIDQHDHAEHILHDGLGNVLNVDVQLGAHRADLGNDTHRVLPDDRDDCFHKMTPSKCPMINGILPL